MCLHQFKYSCSCRSQTTSTVVPSDTNLCSGDTGTAASFLASGISFFDNKCVKLYFYAFSFILFYSMCHMFAAFTSVYVSLWTLKSEIKNKEKIIGQSRIVGGGCRRLDFCLGSTVTWKVTKSNGVAVSQGPRM